MSSIKLYNTLRKIPGVDAAEAQEVVDDVVSKNEVVTKADIVELEGKVKEEMATKADIKDMATKADLEKLEAKIEAKVERTVRVAALWTCSFMVGYSLVLIAVIQLFTGK